MKHDFDLAMTHMAVDFCSRSASHNDGLLSRKPKEPRLTICGGGAYQCRNKTYCSDG